MYWLGKHFTVNIGLDFFVPSKTAQTASSSRRGSCLTRQTGRLKIFGSKIFRFFYVDALSRDVVALLCGLSGAAADPNSSEFLKAHLHTV